MKIIFCSSENQQKVYLATNFFLFLLCKAELLSEIVSEAFPKTAPPSFYPCEFMSPDSPPAKKNTKKRDAPKDKDKDKDPNAPKKPANAFFMYCQQQRNVMQDDQKDPSIGHHELTKSLAKEWNNLATDDKKVCRNVDEMRAQL